MSKQQKQQKNFQFGRKKIINSGVDNILLTLMLKLLHTEQCYCGRILLLLTYINYFYDI